MKKFFTQKLVTPALAVLLVLIAVGVTIGAVSWSGAAQPAMSSAELYTQAIKDALTIESDEIRPVVTITPQSDMATVNDDGDVLLITWHKYPESYIPGEDAVLSYGEVWCFTDKEIARWYDSHNTDVADWELRFEQLLGLPEEKEYTHFTGMWVPMDAVKRPAYTYDIAQPVTETRFDDNADSEYVSWFDANIIYSYFDSAYPWTRLGYTYDWSGAEYGLSEFIVEKDTVAHVAFTYTTDEFIDWLETQ